METTLSPPREARSRTQSSSSTINDSARRTKCTLTILNPVGSTAGSTSHAARADIALQAPSRFGPDLPIFDPVQQRKTTEEEDAIHHSPRSMATSFSDPLSTHSKTQEQQQQPQADEAHSSDHDQHVQVHLIGDPDILLPFLDRPQEVSELLFSHPNNSALTQRIETCLSPAGAWQDFLRVLKIERAQTSDLDWLEWLRGILAPRSPELWSALERCLGAQCLLYLHGRGDESSDRSKADSLACQSWLEESPPTAESVSPVDLEIDDPLTLSDQASACDSDTSAPEASFGDDQEDDENDIGSGFVIHSFKESASHHSKAAEDTSIYPGRMRRHSSGYQHPSALLSPTKASFKDVRIQDGPSSMQFEVLHQVPDTFRERVGQLRHTSRIELEYAQRSESDHHEHSICQAENSLREHLHAPPPQSYSPVKLRSTLQLSEDECPDAVRLSDISEEGTQRDTKSSITGPPIAPTSSPPKEAAVLTTKPISPAPARRLSTCLNDIDTKHSSAVEHGQTGATGLPAATLGEDPSAESPLEAFMRANDGRFAGFRISTGVVASSMAVGMEMDDDPDPTTSRRTSASNYPSQQEHHRFSWASVQQRTDTAPTSVASSSPGQDDDARSRLDSTSKADTFTRTEEGEDGGSAKPKIHFSRHRRLSSLLTMTESGTSLASLSTSADPPSGKFATTRSRRAATSAGILMLGQPHLAGVDEEDVKDETGRAPQPYRATASEVAHRFSQHLRHLQPKQQHTSHTHTERAGESVTDSSAFSRRHRRVVSEDSPALGQRQPWAGSKTTPPAPSPSGASLRPGFGGLFNQGQSDKAQGGTSRFKAGAGKPFQLGSIQSGTLGSRRNQAMSMQDEGQQSASPLSMTPFAGAYCPSPVGSDELKPGALSPAEQRRRSLSFALNFGGLTLTPRTRMDAFASTETNTNGTSPAGEAVPEAAEPPSRSHAVKKEPMPVQLSKDIVEVEQEGEEQDEDEEERDVSPAELAAQAEHAGLEKASALGLLPDRRTRHPTAAHRAHRGSRGSRGSMSSLGSRRNSESATAGGGGDTKKAVLAFRSSLDTMSGMLESAKTASAVAHESDEEDLAERATTDQAKVGAESEQKDEGQCVDNERSQEPSVSEAQSQVVKTPTVMSIPVFRFGGGGMIPRRNLDPIDTSSTSHSIRSGSGPGFGTGRTPTSYFGPSISGLSKAAGSKVPEIVGVASQPASPVHTPVLAQGSIDSPGHKVGRTAATPRSSASAGRDIASLNPEFGRHLESMQRHDAQDSTPAPRSGFALGGGFALPKPSGLLHDRGGTAHHAHGHTVASGRDGTTSPDQAPASLSASHSPTKSHHPRSSYYRPHEAISIARFARERGLDPTGQYSSGARMRAHSSGSTWSESAQSTGSQVIASSESSTVAAPEEWAAMASENERSRSPHGRYEWFSGPVEEEENEEADEREYETDLDARA